MNTEIKLDKNGLPSIRALINSTPNHSPYRFVRPVVGDGVVDLNLDSLLGGFSYTAKMVVKKLSLFGRRAIPFHLHPHREKLYTYQSGIFTLYLLIEGRFQCVSLTSKNPVAVIPEGTPHALFTHDHDLGGGQTSEHSLIEVSPADDDPTTHWEKDIRELLRDESFTSPGTISLGRAASEVKRIS